MFAWLAWHIIDRKLFPLLFSTNYWVTALHNEEKIKLPGCDTSLGCSWDKFLNEYDFLEDCHFFRLCIRFTSKCLNFTLMRNILVILWNGSSEFETPQLRMVIIWLHLCFQEECADRITGTWATSWTTGCKRTEKAL